MENLYQIFADAPPFTRATIQFDNWTSPGMVIVGEKLSEDAAMFRLIAKQLRSYIAGAEGRAAEELKRSAGAMETMAGQYEQAARGESSQAR